MAEQAELQAKIAAIAGQINHHKQAQGSPRHHPRHAQSRWSPYYAPTHLQTINSRQLILNPTANKAVDAAQALQLTSLPGRPNQLATREVLDREAQYLAKRQRRNQQEQGRILRHFETRTGDGRDLQIAGVGFRMSENGTKLHRIPGVSLRTVNLNKRANLSDASTAGIETPRQTRIVGVQYLRTKNGNLVRGSALRYCARHPQRSRLDLQPVHDRPAHHSHIKKPQCEHFIKHGTSPRIPRIRQGPNYPSVLRYDGEYAHRLSLTLPTGSCPNGSRCKGAHDPFKVAICKDFLHTNSCDRGTNCDMSHEMTYHRVSACTYFLRGNCNKSACRYPHVLVAPDAPVCRAFATLGFCAHGPDCAKRHVFECPEYANTGVCTVSERGGRCPLPHPDRASILRKAAERQAKADGDEDVSSDEDEEAVEMIGDVDSDAEDIVMQQDFVAL